MKRPSSVRGSSYSLSYLLYSVSYLLYYLDFGLVWAASTTAMIERTPLLIYLKYMNNPPSPNAFPVFPPPPVLFSRQPKNRRAGARAKMISTPFVPTLEAEA